MKIRKLLLEMNQEQEIRNAAWLYLLTYPYKGVMKISSWENDNRMGIKFIDAMSNLSKQGLVDIDNDKIKSTNRAPSYLGRIFGSFDSEEDALIKGEEFERFDTKSFTISTIPYDIFEHDYQIKLSSKKGLVNSYKYSILINWLKKYQRTPNISFPSALKEFKGNSDLIDVDKRYTLFRGLFISGNDPNIEKFRNLEKGDYINNSKISWSWSKKSALGFAKGSTNWMDSEKFKPGTDVAILLQHTFDHDELLCDLFYLDSVGVSFIDFPGEKEVIVLPKKYKCKIYDILK